MLPPLPPLLPLPPQVLENSLEAKVLRSDSSALAKDCRQEIKALNTRLIKLGGCGAVGGWVRGQ